MTWYFTFGSGQLGGTNSFVRMDEMTAGEARDFLVSMLGLKYCGQYDQEQWDNWSVKHPTNCMAHYFRKDLPSEFYEGEQNEL